MPRVGLAPPRPRQVVVASWLLLCCALLAALDASVAGLALRHLNGVSRAFIETIGPSGDLRARLAELHGDLVYDTALASVGGLCLGIFGVAIRQPWRTIRTLSWCLCSALAVSLIIGMTASPENVMTISPSDPDAMRQAADNLLIPWYSIVQSIIAAAEILVLVAIVIQLSQSAAGDYYRKVRDDTGPGIWSLLPEIRRARDADGRQP